MTTLITRLFADKGTASQVSEALLSDGFNKRAVRAIEGGDSAARDAMADMGISGAAAEAYASKMAGGNALVAVRAPFGRAGSAMTVFDRFDPIEVDVAEETHIRAETDPRYAKSIIPGNKKFLTMESAVGSGTGFSDTFGMRLLSRNQRGKASVDTSTISSKFGMRMLSSNQRGKAKVGTSTISEKMGLKLVKQPSAKKSIIRNNPTPFSSALGLPTLTDLD